ncbi:MAG: thioredoxin [Odoribacter sp.]|nr:thioredoxin [Odoribacter sp.]MDY3033237.1 thioredoxin [Odoribacter sp.]
MALAVNDSNFDEVVLNSEQPAMVDFWAEWCGPCKMMLPIVEEISAEFEGKLTVAKVDVDSSQGTAAKFGIRNIPTILFFKGGKVVDKQVGAVPKAALVDKINKLL